MLTRAPDAQPSVSTPSLLGTARIRSQKTVSETHAVCVRMCILQTHRAVARRRERRCDPPAAFDSTQCEGTDIIVHMIPFLEFSVGYTIEIEADTPLS